MILIILSSLIALVIAGAGLFLYDIHALTGIIVSYLGLAASIGFTVKRNLLTTRLFFYGVLALNGILFYKISGSPVPILLTLVIGGTLMPSETTFRRTGSGFRGVNMATYAGTVVSLIIAAYIWVELNNVFWTAFPYIVLTVVGSLMTYMGQTFVVSNRKSSWNVKVGEAVPEFTAPKRGGKGEFKLSDERGRYVLVNFIRGDWCPICQVHMQIYRKESDRLKENNVKLLVVCRESGLAAQKFGEQVGLEFDLLEDPDLKLEYLFGAVDQKTKKSCQAIPLPVSFLIGPEGKLEYSSNPDDLLGFLDPNDVLEKVRHTLPAVAVA